MGKNAMPKSPVVILLDHVYANSLDSTGHSWLRLNQAMSGALVIAIAAGFRFAIGDFKHIVENYKSGYWLGEVEQWYTQAVSVDNTSAIEAFENWRGRGPLIADDVSGIQSRRLAVGATLPWKGYKVTVTSFKEDGSCTACAYANEDLPEPPAEIAAAIKIIEAGGYRAYNNTDTASKVTRRFVITREAIIQDRAERKRREVIMLSLSQFVADDETRREQIHTMLGTTSSKVFARLTLETMERVLKKCQELWVIEKV